MHVLKTVILALAPISAIAAEPNEANDQQAFARQMMTCAAKNSTYALGPGDASIVAAATPKSESYLTAAIKAAGEKYVSGESEKVKDEALTAVIEKWQSLKSTDEIIASWHVLLKDCDSQLNANSVQAVER